LRRGAGLRHQPRANSPTPDCRNHWYDYGGQVTTTGALASHRSARRSIHSDCSAGAPFTNSEGLSREAHDFATSRGRHHFFEAEAIAFNAWLSSVRSPTICRKRPSRLSVSRPTEPRASLG
jgi:hypothetical protein